MSRPDLIPENHTGIDLPDLHLRRLSRLAIDGDHLHIGTGKGVLSLSLREDSAGREISAQLRTHNLEREVAGTALLLTQTGELRVIDRPGPTARLWIGDTWFELPRHQTTAVHYWLRHRAFDACEPHVIKPARAA